MTIDELIKDLENNDNVPSYDKLYYIDHLKKLKENPAKETPSTPKPKIPEKVKPAEKPQEKPSEKSSEKPDELSKKIDEGTITCEDLDKLIDETFKSSILDRVQRRVRRDPAEKHIDNVTGHQPLSSPNMTDRITPKHDKHASSQMRHRGKSGHKRSTQSQIRNAKNA
jgi:hypothetical protein